VGEVRVEERWWPFEPKLADPQARVCLVGYARALCALPSAAVGDERARAIEALRQQHLGRRGDRDESSWRYLSAAAGVLTDIAQRGWRLRVVGEALEFAPLLALEVDGDETMKAQKEQVRRQLLIERANQLREPPTRAVIADLERRRVIVGADGPRFASIFSLMRDGRALAAALQLRHGQGAAALREVIDPYLQIIEPASGRQPEPTCSHTGLKLQEVWRYFRHTWATTYRPTPGRGMSILIRDRAAPYHPVIGIAALSSPAVQLSDRDRWIGWEADSLSHAARATTRGHVWPPTDELARWLDHTVEAAIEETHKEDLIDGADDLRRMRDAAPALLARLRRVAEEQRDAHQRFADPTQLKREDKDTARLFAARAGEPLYRSKRAAQLADLLEARAALRRCWGDAPSGARLAELLQDAQGRRLCARIVRKAKGDRVGVSIADINVCGAVPPYNELLGGKLVAALLTSPELTDAYRARYASTYNLIASAMAGRPISRGAELVALCTSSLYGPSSQYNRLRLPCGPLGGDPRDELRYLLLGETVGYGTDHFSGATTGLLGQLAENEAHGAVVNSIFGEGVNPKLRKVRAGLDLLGLPSDALLRHNNQRSIYGVALARNFREVLLGMQAAPDYLLPQGAGAEVTARIAAWWRERWLVGRAKNPEVLARVQAHTLVTPVTHGARVLLPPLDTAQLSLGFED
jgi:hypothetical protein